MAAAQLTKEEIAQRGHQIYLESIRASVENDSNLGKIVSIDIETGDYLVDDDLLQAAQNLQANHPGAAVWSERIGYDAVYALGAGTITRTDN